MDEFGRVDLQKLKDSIRPDTTFIGVMTANNEIGTIQPIAEISALARERRHHLFYRRGAGGGRAEN